MSCLHLGGEANYFPCKNSGSPLLSRPVTVLVVDDHALVRSAVSQALGSHPEIKLVITAQDYAQAEAYATQHKPDVIWLYMHIANNKNGGIAEINRLKQIAPSAHILAVTDEENEQEAFEAIMVGVQGYCLKQDIGMDAIIAIIRKLCGNEFVLSPRLLTRLMQRLRAAAMPLRGSDLIHPQR